MTLRMTQEGYAFPDPDRLELDHNLVDRYRLRPPPTLPTMPPALVPPRYRDRDLAVFVVGEW